MVDSANAVTDQSADVAVLEDLRSADFLLYQIFDNLVTANAALCDRKTGVTGMLLHSLAIYGSNLRGAVRTHFDFRTAVAVEEVVPGSGASRAGVRRNDSVVSIGNTPLANGPFGRPQLNALLRRLGADGAGGSVDITVRRGEATKSFRIGTTPACAGLIELRIAERFGASTDGDIIQVSAGLYNLVAGDGDILAAVVAHELAHIILDHPKRLDDAKVARGVLSGLGRSGRLWRRTENEADLLSVYLLANAGYNPEAAAALWRQYGKRLDSFQPLPTHSGWRMRERSLAAEALVVRGLSGRPVWPAWYANRHQPLD